jgi:uncharacterized protein Yka (UPF0111/DUF47 family)
MESTNLRLNSILVSMNFLNIFQSKGDTFYKWFEDASENNHQAALLLEKLCKDFKTPKKISQLIHNREHRGDQISHKIYNEINSVFVTPIDREDIISLTRALDDVIDLIHASSSALVTHNVKRITPIAKRFSKIITSSTKIVSTTLPKLRHRRNFPEVQKAIIELNSLENEGDDLLREGLTELFKSPKNPVDIIRWKDIYAIMEDTTDKTEEISHVLQSLITKYA